MDHAPEVDLALLSDLTISMLEVLFNMDADSYKLSKIVVAACVKCLCGQLSTLRDDTTSHPNTIIFLSASTAGRWLDQLIYGIDQIIHTYSYSESFSDTKTAKIHQHRLEREQNDPKLERKFKERHGCRKDKCINKSELFPMKEPQLGSTASYLATSSAEVLASMLRVLDDTIFHKPSSQGDVSCDIGLVHEKVHKLIQCYGVMHRMHDFARSLTHTTVVDLVDALSALANLVATLLQYVSLNYCFILFYFIVPIILHTITSKNP